MGFKINPETDLCTWAVLDMFGGEVWVHQMFTRSLNDGAPLVVEDVENFNKWLADIYDETLPEHFYNDHIDEAVNDQIEAWATHLDLPLFYDDGNVYCYEAEGCVDDLYNTHVPGADLACKRCGEQGELVLD